MIIMYARTRAALMTAPNECKLIRARVRAYGYRTKRQQTPFAPYGDADPEKIKTRSAVSEPNAAVVYLRNDRARKLVNRVEVMRDA